MISRHALYRLLHSMVDDLDEATLDRFGQDGWYRDTLSDLDVQEKATLWRIAAGEGWE